MTRFLLDTGIASDFVNRRRHVFERARGEITAGNPVGIAIPVLAELSAGVEHSSHPDRNRKSLKAALATLKIWPMDTAAAFEYGRCYAELATLGRPIGTADLMIVAIARTLGNCVVVSADSDFLSVPGLKVENWRM
jgi:tRNA(fMet)-specific endonuclease VapC